MSEGKKWHISKNLLSSFKFFPGHFFFLFCNLANSRSDEASPSLLLWIFGGWPFWHSGVEIRLRAHWVVLVSARPLCTVYAGWMSNTNDDNRADKISCSQHSTSFLMEGTDQHEAKTVATSSLNPRLYRGWLQPHISIWMIDCTKNGWVGWLV